jgi:glucose-1-phosphatase
MAKLIIFDIGGVLEDFAEEDYIKYITKKLNIDKRSFSRRLFAVIPNVERARASTRSMLAELAERFGVSIKSLEWSSALPKLARPNKRMIRLANSLKKNYKVVLLTNVSASRYRENVRMGLFDSLKGTRVFASCYLKMIKPAPEIYRYVLRKMKTKPSDAIFIDNLQVNVDGAKAVGIDGIVFTGYRKLLKDLKKRGIKC